jgi:hypothetical protein
LSTDGSLATREKYDHPTGFLFQINAPKLQSDATKFGGELGVLSLSVDFVFRQFIESLGPVKM